MNLSHANLFSDTRILASWLYDQCLQHGVEFRFNQTIGSDTARDIGAVSIANVNDHSQKGKMVY
ncbi:hypothetical protein LTR28_011129 [Elasticomyces elasticus]|nr:hypothetical protein LTR28_011129 [Elasticomyces elasticus]